MEALLETPGYALFVTGLLSMLLAAAWILRNWVAGVMWSISTTAFVFVGVFGLPREIFWLSVILTLLSLAVGMVVRFQQ